MGVTSNAEGDAIMTCPPQVTVINDTTGMQIVGLEGQTIEIIADETVMSITPEVIELEAPDISLSSEGAVEVESSDVDVTTGGLEVETGDLSLSAGAVEAEAGLFTVM